MRNYRDTSREAWTQLLASGGSATIDDRIIKALVSNPDGLTDDQIEVRTGVGHQTISGNRRHLVERGYVRDTGERREIRSGRRAIVWAAADELIDQLAPDSVLRRRVPV